MAAQPRIHLTSGLTVKAQITRDDGLVFDGTSAMVASSTLSDAQWLSALVAMTEDLSSDATGTGWYLAAWPAGLTRLANYGMRFYNNPSAPTARGIGEQSDPTGYTTDLNLAISELGVATPTATPTVKTALMLMYMALRNKLKAQTSGTDALELYNDAGTKIASKLLTDDGSDYIEEQMT